MKYLLVLFLVQPAVADVPIPQCVRIFVEEADGLPMMGSGALISKDVVVTCQHVVKNRSGKIEVLFPDWTVIQGRVWKEDKQLDIAIIVLEQIAKCKPLIIIGDRLPTELSVHGYGVGIYRKQTGTLSPKTYGPRNRPGIWRQVDGAEARSGDSGGPVLDSKGRYCGTLWGHNEEGGTLFTPVHRVMGLFK